ncbi:ATP-binding cassette sub-family C member 8-like isoform X3 [Branchiostoma floridae]|uniref:ATP-binding cassette sub-family C member 8-like isoform X2 n=1 Tax=Branchiostoma floridae TaxID=7739 RepID=A0A9J7HLT8_BRAFL|nr:ATP-binding cassette sub-family C member 8-like isoform X2 [Branchiostoma floridae]XP_035660616.1 ATP-binding cassette sub-family C member 8-like isoform X3 [Branchiostoma floridae]
MDFWLADWSASHVGGNIDAWNLTEANANYTQGNLSQPMDVPDTTGYYITGYTGLSVGAIVLTAAAVAAAILTSLRGARVMHDRMVHNIVRAPLRFFDTTPTGRILNRMAGDQGSLDNNLPGNMELFLRSGLKIVSAIVAVAVITPYFLIGMIPIIVFYYFMQKIYRATARELKRINLMKESPVYSQLSQSFGGLSTIRAYRAEERFTKQMMERLNDSFVPLLYSMGAEGWMGVRLVCAGAVIIFVAGLSSVVAGLHGLVSPAWVGLAISYAIRMQVQMFSVVSAFAKVEANMTSVERVEIYSRVPGEIYEQKTGNTIPPEEWPKSGTVQLESVTARYDQTLDPVLTTVTANIRAGEKVGICGRTGSGKSSLTLTLFRMIDMFEGVISIDGVDISRVPLTLLRSRLSIIPQDPVLFSGTIRFNLDPEEDSDDDELWRALEIAQLKDVVTDLPSKLDEMVTEGGENFSVGQRQLFCLARAFVRKSRILIMDEATASVDMETDAILQDVIKVAFGDRTVITVAHRIATILNSDRILVLDQGKLVENDSPDNLLKKPDGLFTAMVKANK